MSKINKYTNTDTFQSRQTANGESDLDNIALAGIGKVGGITDKIVYSNNFVDTTGLAPTNATLAVASNILTVTATVSNTLKLVDLQVYESKKIYVEFSIKSDDITSITLNGVSKTVTSGGTTVSGIVTPATTEELSIILTASAGYNIKDFVVRAIGELGDGALTAEEIQYKYGTGYKETGLVYNIPDKIVSLRKNLIDIDNYTDILNNEHYATEINTGIKIMPDISYVLTYDYHIDSHTETFSGSLGLSSTSTGAMTYEYPYITFPNQTSGLVTKIFSYDSEHIQYADNYLVLRLARFNASGNGEINISNIQLEYGTTATDYEPYHEDIFTIPQPTIAEELSYSTPTLRNYIEFAGEKKYFHKILNKVDLGTLTYTYGTAFTATITGMSTTANDLICDKYSYGNDITKSANTIVITDADYTDATSFKNAMSGVYLIYPLETEVVTELEDDFVDNMFVPNKSGIEYFQNENGDLVSGYLEATYYDRYPMIRIGDYFLPEPSTGGYKPEANDLVSGARNTSGEMIGTMVRANISKLYLTWKVISTEDWAEMVQHFTETDEYGGSFTNYVTFWNDVANGFITKLMYVSKRTCGVYIVDKKTGRPKYYTNASLDLIEV